MSDKYSVDKDDDPSDPSYRSSLLKANSTGVMSEDDSLIRYLEDVPTNPSALVEGSNARSSLGQSTTATESLLRNSQRNDEASRSSSSHRSFLLNPLTKMNQLTVNTSGTLKHHQEEEEGPPPIMSPNEELKLLAVKHKPNSPDRDNGGMAPNPPRSVPLKRAAVKGRPLIIQDGDLSSSGSSYAGDPDLGYAQYSQDRMTSSHDPVSREDAHVPMAAKTFLNISSNRPPMKPGTMAISLSESTSIGDDGGPLPLSNDPMLASASRDSSQGGASSFSTFGALPPQQRHSNSRQQQQQQQQQQVMDNRPSSPREGRAAVRPGAYPGHDSRYRGRTDTKFSHSEQSNASRRMNQVTMAGMIPPAAMNDFSDELEARQSYAASYLQIRGVAPSSSMCGTSQTGSLATNGTAYSADLDIAHSGSSDQDTYGSSLVPLSNRADLQNRRNFSSDHLVRAEAYDERTNLEVMRREAERDTEARLMAAAINVDTKIIDDYQAGGGFNWKLYGSMGCLLIGMVTAVAVVFATRGDDDESDIKPILPPAINKNCDSALQLVDFDGGTVQGKILGGTEGNLEVTCQVEDGEGYTLWYFLVGDDSRLSASTCEGTDVSDDSDTQVLVFSGSCGSLQCIGGADQQCGSHGSVGWLAEQGQRYYIVVKGFRTFNEGTFTLTLDTRSDSGRCEDAIKLDSPSLQILGSTRNLIFNEAVNDCNQTGATGSWYTYDGDGTVICALASSERTGQPEFPVELSILEGDSCSALSCIGTALPRSDDEAWMTEDVAFFAEDEKKYSLVVRGAEEMTEGDFLLRLFVSPPNGICETAEPLLFDEITLGTMINACNEPVSGCREVLDKPGVWYSVEGTGELLISEAAGLTCQDNFEIRSKITVFSGGGGCNELTCAEFTSIECTAGNDKVISQWYSNKGEPYYIYVQSLDSVDFDVSIEEFLPGGSDTCGDASDLTTTGTSAITLGTTVGANPADLGECANSGAGGVWYFVQGTGEELVASTCNTGTNYSTGITILEGVCGDFTCVEAQTITCDGERAIAFWNTTVGLSYSVYIHGQEATDTGRFLLTLDGGTLDAPNDFCGTAVEVSVPSTSFGSSFNSTIEDVDDLCGNVATGPGVWYTVIGQGFSLTASLCGEGTNFDTQIYIFSGDNCTDLACIEFDEDSCGTQSRASWNAELNSRYHILVSGFNNQVGDFELLIL